MNGNPRAGRATSFILATAAVAVLATGAPAHVGDHWPLLGKSLKMASSLDGGDNRFKFKGSGQFSLPHDAPNVTRSTLIVRGSGSTPGSTDVIVLKQGLWRPVGPVDAPKGWKYSSDIYDTQSGGITKIQIKSGSKNGSLQLQAKGYYWPFQIDGPQDSIQIVLTIGDYAYCAEFSTDLEAVFKANLEGELVASSSSAPTQCPQVCGNGVLEDGEQCDDGNFIDGDTCSNACVGCDPDAAEYASTFEGIQDKIFDGYGCSNDTCHGLAAESGLDLRTGNSYDELLNVTGEINDTYVRVFPGDQDLSLLYKKIAMRTLGTTGVGGQGMPFSGSAVTEEHLEAIREWIRGGAPETGVVAGTAALLGSCLPPPTPLKIPQPEVPDPLVGTQLAQPGYTLLSQTEVEGCVATYYDVSETVPASAIVDCPGAFPGTNETGVNAGKCFSWNGNRLYQDAQSHHSIVHIYPGNYSWNDPGWGSWRCYGGSSDGNTCSPTGADPCPDGGVCGSKFHKGVACLDTQSENWGSPDFNTSNAPQFSGSQESTANANFPNGVYALLPLKGLVVWNSHAFNHTTQNTTMNAWINLTYTADRQYPAQGLFANQYIFTQNVLPFQQKEYCATYTFPEGARLFQLTSHTHKRGVKWRYYDAPQPLPNQVGSSCYAPGGSTNASCTPGNIADQFYISFDYSDPEVMAFDPPKVFTGAATDRTIKFCSLFDNGFTNASSVKRQSTSPVPTGNLIVGGPCNDNAVRCLGGPNKGNLCNGNDSNCPESVCDACPLLGGVTTEDEMFIAIGTYYVP